MELESFSAAAWNSLREFLRFRVGGRFGRVDLHDTTLSMRARRAYCAEHGLVIVEPGRPHCWCGDSVILKAEADRMAEDLAPLSMANDPTWRC